VVEKGERVAAGHGVNRVADDARSHEPIRENGTRHGSTSALTTGEKWSYTTTGWRPTCEHDAEPVPATVLDPFCGSGTTGVVCQEHGRRFVGVDISGPYLRKQARKRLGLEALAAWTNGKRVGEITAPAPLFSEVII
jgi:hypothetical protein